MTKLFFTLSLLLFFGFVDAQIDGNTGITTHSTKTRLDMVIPSSGEATIALVGSNALSQKLYYYNETTGEWKQQEYNEQYEKLHLQNTNTLHTFGNSITFGSGVSIVSNRYPNRVVDTLDIILNNQAVSGTEITDLYADMSILPIPNNVNDIALLSYGTNDMRDENNSIQFFLDTLDLVVDSLYGLGWKPYQIVINSVHAQVDCYYTNKKVNEGGPYPLNLEKHMFWNQNIRKYCLENVLRFSDTYNHMQELGFTSNDCIHPNADGHSGIVQAVLESIRGFGSYHADFQEPKQYITTYQDTTGFSIGDAVFLENGKVQMANTTKEEEILDGIIITIKKNRIETATTGLVQINNHNLGASGNIYFLRDDGAYSIFADENYLVPCFRVIDANHIEVIVNSVAFEGGVNSFSVTDPDVTNFVAVSGITDDIQILYVSKLISELKVANLWDSIYAFWVFLGEDATTQSYNLKDPTQHQLTFSEMGLTYTNRELVLEDGHSVNTNFNAFTDLDDADDVAFLIRNNVVNTNGVGVDMGANAGTAPQWFFANDLKSGATEGRFKYNNQIVNFTKSQGTVIASNTGGVFTVLTDAGFEVDEVSKYTPPHTASDINYYIGSTNGTSFKSNGTYRNVAIMKSLTKSQMSELKSIVDRNLDRNSRVVTANGIWKKDDSTKDITYSQGRVGIGLTNPTSLFHVHSKNDGVFAQFQCNDGTDDEKFLIYKDNENMGLTNSSFVSGLEILGGTNVATKIGSNGNQFVVDGGGGTWFAGRVIEPGYIRDSKGGGVYYNTVTDRFFGYDSNVWRDFAYGWDYEDDTEVDTGKKLNGEEIHLYTFDSLSISSNSDADFAFGLTPSEVKSVELRFEIGGTVYFGSGYVETQSNAVAVDEFVKVTWLKSNTITIENRSGASITDIRLSVEYTK